MNCTYLIIRKLRVTMAQSIVFAAGVILVGSLATRVTAQRVFGVDTADVANASAPSQAAWNNAFNDADGDGVAYKFAFVRALFGNSSAADTQFYTNISRATTAGLLTGSYHFVTPDTTNGVTEANNYIAKAGMYMKPGYLLPVLDLESGNGQSTAALTQWCLDYINTLHNTLGIYPIVYTNSAYNNDEVTAAVAFATVSGRGGSTNPITYQWLARPGSASLATGQPQPALPTYPDPYGVWDPNFSGRSTSVDPAVKPWAFWQNGSGAPNGFTVDYNAANGNIEYVKDFLVPALWTNSGSGTWQTIANWNSNNPGGGAAATGPASRLPNSLDWVKLQNAGGGTITLSSGAQSIRKLYTQQTLFITGGSLSIGYIPGSGGKFDVPSEFNAVVKLSGTASYSAHTTQIDGGTGFFGVGGGTVTFHTFNLASHATLAGRMELAGDVTFTPSTLGGTGTAVIQSTGSLTMPGTVMLSDAMGTLTITDGAPAVDVSITAGITGDGELTKAGAGTLQLSGNNTYLGGTTIKSGLLTLAGANAKLGPGDVILQASAIGTELQIQSGVANAIANTATLSLSNGVVAQGGLGALIAGGVSIDLGAGINETVQSLLLNGVAQGPGTYGSSTSGALFKNNAFFSGTGVITVLAPEPASASLLMLGLMAVAVRRRARNG
jgi:autotransporter-associated beta strand protein